MIEYAIKYPKRIIYLMLLVTAGLLAFVPLIQIDTDPENMLAADEEVRIKHHEMKEKYNMYDMIVLGVINDQHPDGVFNKESLTKVYELTEFVKSIELEGKEGGIIEADLMTPSTVDHIAPTAPGTIQFDYLMSSPPANDKEASEIKNRLMDNEMYYNTIVSEDGKAIALYIPISSKDISYNVSNALQEKINTYDGDEDFHITGLPVAEDTFGVEMFIQMGITAPAAMICIFILLFIFFKKLKLIWSPMILAMVSVLCTMGLLIATGNTVHIMSSMIAIFIMPIAVLDSVHILSEFFDRYQETKDREHTIRHVIKELFRPMLFTSLTSAAGFASLALTPIPPVKVFGIFVAFGIMLAWLLTMTFMPAYIMLMKEETLSDFGSKPSVDDRSSWLSRMLLRIQNAVDGHAGKIILATLAFVALTGYGITKIQINDNPVKWFTPSHPIRVADQALNEHFGGTYMAYLSLEAAEYNDDVIDTKALTQSLEEITLDYENGEELLGMAEEIILLHDRESSEYYNDVSDEMLSMADEADTDEEAELWEDLASKIELSGLQNSQIFKNPKMLNYIDGLERHLLSEGGVGKISSLPLIVKKINKELHESNSDYFKIPESFSGVAQSILSFQNSHYPDRLRHFATADYTGVNLWLQLKSGDNREMEKTVATLETYIENNPPPIDIDHHWSGLTYINVVWQSKMVAGMLNAFLGSFAVVFLMMALLFRSIKWAALCMLPLTVTIVAIYGIIGWIGKDYDMPVAVLSSLALGLAIDFAIHFLVRSRAAIEKHGTWTASSSYMFGEPSRAIVRNVIVIAVGFLPLLLSNLIPYKTVGVLLASILLLSGIVTLLLLPSCIAYFKLKK